jgi:hypothetical protein
MRRSCPASEGLSAIQDVRLEEKRKARKTGDQEGLREEPDVGELGVSERRGRVGKC